MIRSLFVGLAITAALATGAAAQAKGFLGVRVEANAAELEDVGEHVGVRIVEVVANSPAQAAGLKTGDVIESVGGTSYRWPDAFHAAIDRLPPGAPVRLEVVRDDVAFTVDVTPVARTRARPEHVVTHLVDRERIGVRFGVLTRAEARAAGFRPSEGVRIAGFWGQSPWARDGVRAGDLLHRMNGRPVHDPREVIRRVRLLPVGAPVELELVRAGAKIRVRSTVSRRARRTERVLVPLLFNYRSPSEEESEWGVLFDVFQTRFKDGQRRTKLFWIISWTTGEAQSLREVDVPDAPAGSPR